MQIDSISFYRSIKSSKTGCFSPLKSTFLPYKQKVLGSSKGTPLGNPCAPTVSRIKRLFWFKTVSESFCISYSSLLIPSYFLTKEIMSKPFVRIRLLHTLWNKGGK
jgi:hypothetical protein